MAGKIEVMRVTAATLALLFAGPLLAQGPQNVLLVVNKDSKVSKAVGEYYRQRRGVPQDQVCTVRTLDVEEISRFVFEDEIRRPLLDCLARRKLQDRILYIVLTKGVPHKVKGSEQEHASVDSELTLLYQDLAGVERVLRGKVRNPYFAGAQGGWLSRFSHREFPIYLVTRLDGYDLKDVRALIDRALAPAAAGRFVLDLSRDDSTTGNDWLRQAAKNLVQVGVPEASIRLETSTAFLTGEKGLMGYAGWGSNDRADKSRFLKHTWVNGALAAQFVSTDARTFEKPPKNWEIGQWSDPGGTFFDGSPQSLIADAIEEGVTGIAGNAYEPYLDACVRPQVLFPAYVRGFNLAESFYAAQPFLSWQTVVIGDPLAAPYHAPPLPSAEADPPQDPATGLPVYFSRYAARAKAKRQDASKTPVRFPARE